MTLTKTKGLVIAIVFLLTLYVVYRIKQKQTPVLTGLNNVVLSIFNAKGKNTKLVDINKNARVTFATGAPIDLNNTGEEAIFIGGGAGHEDLLLINKGGRMINIIDQTNLSNRAATFSAVSADLDHNGFTDLVVGRENGVWLYLNQGNGKFIIKHLVKSSNLIPLSLAITDYNKDGHADIYVSQYAHPNAAQESTSYNMLLEGVGRGVFEDVTERTQTRGTRGTTKSVMVDLDGDKLPDLILGQDNGSLEIYKNTRGASGAKFTSQNKFVRMKVPDGIGFSKKLELVDIDNDGDIDIVIPTDKTQVVLRNNGNFNFTKEEVKDDLDFGWNTLMEHLGLGVKKLFGKFNKDKVWINVAGPKKIHSNPTKNKNWIGVKLPDGVPYYNATVKVVSVNDQTGKIRKQSKQNIVARGIGNDPTKIIEFDLDDDNRVLHLEVTTIYDGNRWVHPRPKMNMIATFRDMHSNNYTAKSRDELGQLPINKSDLLGAKQFRYN